MNAANITIRCSLKKPKLVMPPLVFAPTPRTPVHSGSFTVWGFCALTSQTKKHPIPYVMFYPKFAYTPTKTKQRKINVYM